MRMRSIVVGLLAVWLAAGTGRAADAVWIRLVKAVPSPEGVDPALADVAGALQRNLVFKGYRLAGQQSVALPATATATLGPYAISCTGPQNALAVRISAGGRVLLNTTANLQDGKPLILGGFPEGANRAIVVLLAR